MKKITDKFKTKNSIRNISFLVVLTVLFISIGYSAFSGTGVISNVGAKVKAQNDIRITGVTVSNPSASGSSSYEEFTKDTVTSSINLPNYNSKLVYNVEVTNFGNTEMVLKSITGLPSNLKYTLNSNNYALNEMICDDNDSTKCTLAAKKTIKVTIQYTNPDAYDSSTTTFPFTLNFEFKPFNKVAMFNNKYYQSLADAVAKVPADTTQYYVYLLQNTSENFQVKKNQNIVFDFGSNVLRNSANAAVIENHGTVSMSNGTIRTDAATNGAFNNESEGIFNMSGGSIVGVGGRQALYNNGGVSNISGSANLSSSATERPAVSNINSGTMTITGGTIVSTGLSGIVNSATLTIGTKNDDISKNTLSIQGVTYGVDSTTNYSFYDGVLKGKTAPYNDRDKITSVEDDYSVVVSDETISGENYQTAYLGVSYIVTFDPNDGTVTETTRPVEQNTKVGILPVPVRAGYDFDGWFTDRTDGTRINENTIITDDITFFAHWTKLSIVRMNGQYYDTLQEAITAAPANTRTTVTLLRDITENFKIQYNKIIELDLQSYTISHNSSAPKDPIIDVFGKLYMNNGTVSSNGDSAAINVENGGKAYISGGNVYGTAAKQALYILSGGEVEISGDAYLRSRTSGAYSGMDRSTAQCLSGGTLRIIGGTIEGISSPAVSNQGTLTIGDDDGTVSTTTPELIGSTYGVKTNGSGTFNFYDGILKGKTAGISGTVTDQPSGYNIVNGTEGSYKTSILSNE